LVAQAPPQSTSVSDPFLTVSMQAAAVEMHVLALHTELAQSAATAQPLVSAHLPAQVPPQSTSVSVPFFTVSVQVAAPQMLAAHIELAQSAATAQPLVSAHLLAQVPPQSISVSVPFLKPSAHVGSTQTLAPLQSRAAWQSAADPQALPAAHRLTQAPPQSTSVSVPFFCASVQVGAGGPESGVPELELELDVASAVVPESVAAMVTEEALQLALVTPPIPATAMAPARARDEDFFTVRLLSSEADRINATNGHQVPAGRSSPPRRRRSPHAKRRQMRLAEA